MKLHVKPDAVPKFCRARPVLKACILFQAIRAVVDAPIPVYVSELRAFLGLLSCYCKLIPNLTILVYPLNALLQRNKRWQWTRYSETAFNNCKLEMTKVNVLTHYDPALSLSLAGDASTYMT